MSRPSQMVRWYQGAVLLVATGRTSDLKSISAEVLGVDPKTHRALPTNNFLEVVDDSDSIVSGVYAIGDVAGKGAFTHVAVTQGRMVADQILGKPTAPMGHPTGRACDVY